MYDKESLSKYRKIFRDIVRGYSIVDIDNQSFYIKHLTVHDQVDLEDIEEQFYQKAKKRGIPTEKQSLKELIKDGMWKEEDESFIEKQQSYLENLIKGKLMPKT